MNAFQQSLANVLNLGIKELRSLLLLQDMRQGASHLRTCQQGTGVLGHVPLALCPCREAPDCCHATRNRFVRRRRAFLRKPMAQCRDRQCCGLGNPEFLAHRAHAGEIAQVGTDRVFAAPAFMTQVLRIRGERRIPTHRPMVPQ